MSARRFKLEWVDPSHPEGTLWFDTREALDAALALIRGCQVDDGPVRLRVTEYGVVHTEDLSL